MTHDRSVHPPGNLSELDEAARDFRFPGLDNGFIYPVDTRLHAFRGEARWALVIEVVGYDYRGHSLDDVVYVLGNCIDRPFGDDNFLPRIGNFNELEDEEEPVVAAGVESVELRGQAVPVPRPAGTDLVEVFRALTPEFRDLLLADEDELRRSVPTDLPRILVLEECNHPDVFDGALPSRSDTFLRIADVLVDGRPELLNTFWRGESAHHRRSALADALRRISRWPGRGTAVSFHAVEMTAE